ncbi:MAG: deoxyribose-phosphate aldolase [Peptostreptococcaceae bacterium]
MKKNITVEELANIFDHTLLKPFAKEEDFKKLCKESVEYEFKMVAINSAPTKLCKEILNGTKVNVGAAISFPLGQTDIATKVFETENAIKNGADEIDYVINIAELKNKNYNYIKEEMEQIVKVCKENNVTSKVIFENCYLDEDEKIKLCEIALEVRPDFIKTSTGFGTGGATLEDVKLMKSIVKDKVKVKASGGVRDLETALAMIEAGVERIGSSSSVTIVEEYKKLLAKNS